MTVMIEKLIELAAQGWNWLTPFVIVVASQNAGVLRFGRYHRTLAPGFHWKWPLVEEANTQNTCVTTLRLPPQTLTTKDFKVVVVAAIVKYQVKDIEPFITEIWDQTDVLADVTMGAVRKVVSAQAYADLIENPPEATVLDLVRKEVNRYGFKVERVTFTDLAEVFSVRLIQAHPKDISN